MPTITAEYLGNLRVAATHVASGATIITDAPVDNHGKGEAFAPTDLCAASLGLCGMTIMGLYSDAHGLDITGARMEITKTMGKDPRRIAAIEVVFIMPNRAYSDKDKLSLERAMRTCPVHVSLHPDAQQTLIFRWAS